MADSTAPLGEQESREQAYRIMAVALPASYIEAGESRMTPKAVRLRDLIARALVAAYKRSRAEARVTNG